jgi:hypothetical protein
MWSLPIGFLAVPGWGRDKGKGVPTMRANQNRSIRVTFV